MCKICRQCVWALRAGVVFGRCKRHGYNQHGCGNRGAGNRCRRAADSLEKQVKVQKEALSRGDLCLVTPYSPNAGFSVGAAWVAIV
jgi:hypothetical protein